MPGGGPQMSLSSMVVSIKTMTDLSLTGRTELKVDDLDLAGGVC